MNSEWSEAKKKPVPEYPCLKYGIVPPDGSTFCILLFVVEGEGTVVYSNNPVAVALGTHSFNWDEKNFTLLDRGEVTLKN